MKIGVNTFGLGSVLITEDRRTVLKKVKETGVDTLEVCIVCVDPPKAEKRTDGYRNDGIFLIDDAQERIEEIRACGLEVKGAHVMLSDTDLRNIKEIVEGMVAVAKQFQLQYYAISLMKSRPEEMEALVPELTYATERLAEEGIDFLYHNHEVELQPDETGETSLGYLLRRVPGMKLELDVGWAVFAGVDAVETMRQYADRIRIIHFKDIAEGAEGKREKVHFTAIGEGCIPLKEIIEAAAELPLYEQGLVIDQDSSETDEIADLAASVKNIRAGKTVTVDCRIENNPLSLSVWSWPATSGERPGSFRNMLMAARRCGINYVDLSFVETEMYGLQNVKQILQMTGAKVNCCISMLKMQACTLEQAKTQIGKELAEAAELGADKLLVVPFEVSCGNDPDERRKTADHIVEMLQMAVEMAKGTGIKICIEDTPSCFIPLSTAAECKYVLEKVPGLGFAFDTANMIPGGDKEPLAFYEELKEYICHVHLKDIQYTDKEYADPCSDGRRITCVRSGEGIIPVKEIMERIIADGYKGSAMLEYTDPKEHTYAGHLEHLQSFISNLF